MFESGVGILWKGGILINHAEPRGQRQAPFVGRSNKNIPKGTKRTPPVEDAIYRHRAFAYLGEEITELEFDVTMKADQYFMCQWMLFALVDYVSLN